MENKTTRQRIAEMTTMAMNLAYDIETIGGKVVTTARFIDLEDVGYEGDTAELIFLAATLSEKIDQIHSIVVRINALREEVIA